MPRVRSEIHELRTFARPLIAASMASAVDTAVSSFCLARASDTALCAVLPAGSLAGTFVAVITAFLGYAGTVVAKHHGFGRERLVVHSFVQGLWLFALTIPLFIAASPISRSVFSIFGHSDALITDEMAYLNLILSAGAIQALSAVFAGFFTGRGQTRFPGAVLSLGSVINTLLTPLFVLKFDLGISGAGWSRIFAAAIPFVVLAAAAIRDPLVARPATSQGVWRFIPNLTRDLLKLAAPNALRMLVDYGGFFVLTAFIGALDRLSAAASTIVFALTNFYFAIIRGVANGVEILVAQRLSIPNATRCLIRTSIVLSFVYLCAYLVLIFSLGGPIVTAFSGGNSAFSPEALRAAAVALFPILAAREILETLQQLLMGALRGLGRTAALLRIQTITTCLVWLPLLFALRACCPTLAAYWLSMLVYMLTAVVLLRLEMGSRRISRPSGARSPLRSEDGRIR